MPSIDHHQVVVELLKSVVSHGTAVSLACIVGGDNAAVDGFCDAARRRQKLLKDGGAAGAWRKRVRLNPGQG